MKIGIIFHMVLNDLVKIYIPGVIIVVGGISVYKASEAIWDYIWYKWDTRKSKKSKKSKSSTSTKTTTTTSNTPKPIVGFCG